MAKEIKWDVTLDSRVIGHKIENLINDDVMVAIHNLFAKMCNPYVPMDEGPLSQHIEVTPNYVRYAEPYAHYQYMGEVYGPNIPITDKTTGVITGWYSQPGVKKHPTGRELGKDGEWRGWKFGYNREHHPKAVHHWDKVMMSEKGDVFIKGVQDILTRRAKELYG